MITAADQVQFAVDMILSVSVIALATAVLLSANASKKVSNKE